MDYMATRAIIATMQRRYDLDVETLQGVIRLLEGAEVRLNALEAVARAAQAVLDDARIFYDDYKGRASPSLAVIQWDVFTTLRSEVAGLGPRKELNAKAGLVA